MISKRVARHPREEQLFATDLALWLLRLEAAKRCSLAEVDADAARIKQAPTATASRTLARKYGATLAGKGTVWISRGVHRLRVS